MTRRSRAAHLKDITDIVSSVKEGRQLLKLAEKMDCPIILDPKMPKGLDGRLEMTFNAAAEKKKTKYKIRLSASNDDEDVALSLVHELRHLWQCSHFGPEKSRQLSAPLQLVHRRIIEGDAEAFEAYFHHRMDKDHKAARAQDWQEEFFKLQKNKKRSAIHDAFSLDSARQTLSALKSGHAVLAGGFSRHDMAALAGIEKILVPGLDTRAKPYISAKDVAALSRRVRTHIPAAVKAQARALQKDINAQKKKNPRGFSR
ncbi:MAG: hypothetical protein OXT65_02805 [Alphaproteobacteria bacterium]|nr:hypothetical protein [Alphaproteobacteria bacterium]